MAVFVDMLQGCMPTKAWPWAERCRMFADTERELHEAAQRLGLKPEWMQQGIGMHWYNLTRHKRLQAIEIGAVELHSFAESAREMDRVGALWRREKAAVAQTGRLF